MRNFRFFFFFFGIKKKKKHEETFISIMVCVQGWIWETWNPTHILTGGSTRNNTILRWKKKNRRIIFSTFILHRDIGQITTHAECCKHSLKDSYKHTRDGANALHCRLFTEQDARATEGNPKADS